MITTPLQITLCWQTRGGVSGRANDCPAFIEAVGRAFVGRSQVDDFSSAATSIPNWVAGDAIQPLELKRFSNTPGSDAAKLLNVACHTLVVGWLDEESVGNDGVMTEIHRLAVTYQAADRPVITNLLPWPDVPGLTSAERGEAARSLEIREAGLPSDLKKYETKRQGRQPPDPWLRARALTWMRRQIVATVDAQICLGGRSAGSSGHFPGVVEEAYLVSMAEKPLCLSGLLGGASRCCLSATRPAIKILKIVLSMSILVL